MSARYSRPTASPGWPRLTLRPGVQALRELSGAPVDDETRLVQLAGMIQAHQSAKIVDDEAVMDLQSRLEVRPARLAHLPTLPVRHCRGW